MICANHRTAILDIARGVALPSNIVAAAQAHIDGCAQCAARLQRERELSAGLHALAMSARDAGPSADVERRLIARFERSVASRASFPARSTRRHVVPALAAAGVVLAMWWAVPATHQPTPPAPPALAHARQPALPPPAAPDVSAIGRTMGRPTISIAKNRNARPRPRPPVRTLEFEPIPGASALPAFESGHIVRMELPVAALPAYGVEIAPDVARTQVTADVLVGQDGLARGIRLVYR